MKIRALLIDDEPLARIRLKSLLLPYEADIEIVGEASSAEQAQERIAETHPDLIFCDIQLHNVNALDMLQQIEDEDFMIVFTTAYDEFALRSFEENVIDYLLKPIREERFEKTFEKIKNYFSPASTPENFSAENIAALLSKIESHDKSYQKRIQVRIGTRTLLINTDEIIRFKSEDKYTIVYTPAMQYIIDTPLIELEKRLDPQQFIRVHRAHLVAIDYIAEIQRTDVGKMHIILKDKARTSILVSRNFVKRIRDL